MESRSQKPGDRSQDPGKKAFELRGAAHPGDLVASKREGAARSPQAPDSEPANALPGTYDVQERKGPYRQIRQNGLVDNELNTSQLSRSKGEIGKSRGELISTVEPTMLMKIKEDDSRGAVEPTMCMKKSNLRLRTHDVYQNKCTYRFRTPPELPNGRREGAMTGAKKTRCRRLQGMARIAGGASCA